MSDQSRDKVAGWLDDISAATGNTIALNDSGVAAFNYEDLTFVIEVPSQSSIFFFYVVMARPAAYQRLVVYSTAMALNYLQQDTKGGCIGVDSATDELIFSYRDRLDNLGYNEFYNSLENFIDTALTVNRKVNEAMLQADQPQPTADISPQKRPKSFGGSSPQFSL